MFALPNKIYHFSYLTKHTFSLSLSLSLSLSKQTHLGNTLSYYITFLLSLSSNFHIYIPFFQSRYFLLPVFYALLILLFVYLSRSLLFNLFFCLYMCPVFLQLLIPWGQGLLYCCITELLFLAFLRFLDVRLGPKSPL